MDNADIFGPLLDLGASPDIVLAATGEACIHMASRRGRLNEAKRLLKHRANIDLVDNGVCSN